MKKSRKLGKKLRDQEEIVQQMTDQIISLEDSLEAKESLIESLQQKLKEKENNPSKSNGCDKCGKKECVICLEPFSEDIKAMCFFPCGHARTCQDCHKKLDPKAKDSLGRVGKECPECRAKILFETLLFD